MRRTLYYSLVFALMLFAQSCVDHELPGTPPQMETLEFSSGNGWKCSVTFNLDIKDVGTIPVKEYGMVYTTSGKGNAPLANPVVETDFKQVFPMPFLPGKKTKLNEVSNTCGPYVYYRAYAILEDGTVVYGQEIEFKDV
ncbi:hypothetical protein [Dyadobacter psychrophilus]|uniref:Uncharacterized protein n=1 Tax=Dyadobacter psychrophilus TaxID=651661 RepID=A0A1T5CB24_9BACT|nr:hypothetical protein [Dyadobacter psychrophilus]SKB56648.1 hypothetical protein SAMN05660293_01060 [Dyadobacter psychrophilus]